MEGKQEQATIPGQEFFKSLGKLEALVRSDEDVNKSQLHHTSSSERSEWPGGKKTSVGNKWDDSIGDDGTDYKAARKSIAEKVMKGEALSPADVAILKSDQEIDKSESVDKGKDEDDDKEMFGKDKAIKSLGEDNETLQKGIELSPFLSEFAKAFDERISMLEERQDAKLVKGLETMLNNLGTYLEAQFGNQGEFNKSLADVVVGIGNGLSANIQQTAEMAASPVGAPKSTMRAVEGGVRAIEKSFSGPDSGESISKSQVLSAMTDMVEKGSLNPLSVIKYDATGQIDPGLLQKVTTDLRAAGSGR